MVVLSKLLNILANICFEVLTDLVDMLLHSQHSDCSTAPTNKTNSIEQTEQYNLPNAKKNFDILSSILSQFILKCKKITGGAGGKEVGTRLNSNKDSGDMFYLIHLTFAKIKTR
jgi:hypothetical protein